MENVKTFLYNVKDERTEAAILKQLIQEEINTWWDLCQKRGGKVAESETMYIDCLKRSLHRLEFRNQEARKLIDMLEDPRQRRILQAFFLSDTKMSQIAEELHYSERAIYRMYNAALKNLESVTLPENVMFCHVARP